MVAILYMLLLESSAGVDLSLEDDEDESLLDDDWGDDGDGDDASPSDDDGSGDGGSSGGRS